MGIFGRSRREGFGWERVEDEKPKPRAARRRLGFLDRRQIESQKEKALLLLGPSLDHLGARLQKESSGSPLGASRLLAFQEANAILKGQSQPHQMLDKLPSIEAMVSYSNQGDGDRLSTAVQLGLQRQGMVVWRDKSLTYVKHREVERPREDGIGIGAGQDWQEAIDTGIAPSAFGICLLTREALSSPDTFRFIAQQEIKKIQERGKLVFGLVDDQDGSVTTSYRQLQAAARAAGDLMSAALPDLESVPQIPLSKSRFEDSASLGSYIVEQLGRIEGATKTNPKQERVYELLKDLDQSKVAEISASGVKTLLEALTAEKKALGKEWDEEMDLKIQIVEEAGMIAESFQDPEKMMRTFLHNRQVFAPQAEGEIGSSEDRHALQIRQVFEKFGAFKAAPYGNNAAGGYNFVVLSEKSFGTERRARTFEVLKAARYAQTNLSGRMVMIWLEADPAAGSIVGKELGRWAVGNPAIAAMKLLDNQATVRVSEEDFEDSEKLAFYIALKLRIAGAAERRSWEASRR